MRLGYAAILISFAVGSSGCATIVRGSSQSVEFESTPAGALVQSYHGSGCYTPCSLRFSRKESAAVLVSKDGYKPMQINLSAHANRSGVAAAYGNIIIGGGLGAIVDGKTKAFKGFIDPVRVVLEEDPRQAKTLAKN